MRDRAAGERLPEATDHRLPERRVVPLPVTVHKPQRHRFPRSQKFSASAPTTNGTLALHHTPRAGGGDPHVTSGTIRRRAIAATSGKWVDKRTTATIALATIFRQYETHYEAWTGELQR
jgi:hypothetical protein